MCDVATCKSVLSLHRASGLSFSVYSSLPVCMCCSVDYSVVVRRDASQPRVIHSPRNRSLRVRGSSGWLAGLASRLRPGFSEARSLKSIGIVVVPPLTSTLIKLYRQPRELCPRSFTKTHRGSPLSSWETSRVEVLERTLVENALERLKIVRFRVVVTAWRRMKYFRYLCEEILVHLKYRLHV